MGGSKKKQRRGGSAERGAPGGTNAPAGAAASRARGLPLPVVAVLAVAGLGGAPLLVLRLAGAGDPRAVSSETNGGEVPDLDDLDALDPSVASAIRDAADRVRREPDRAEAHGELGRVYHAHKHQAAARRAYLEAHRLEPGAADWPYYLALFAAEAGESERAAAYLEQVLRLRPDYLPAWYHLGEVCLTLDRLHCAERAFARMAALAPADPWGHLGLGMLARRRERWPQAAADLSVAVETSSRAGAPNREALYLLAMTHRELGEAAKAQRLLGQLPGLAATAIPDPLLARALERRADLERLIQEANRRVASGDAAGAEALYRSVLAANPEHFDAHYNLGQRHSRAQRFAEAEPLLAAAVRLRPENPAAHYLLAMTTISLGKPAQGRAHAVRALELDPEHELARDLLRRLDAPE